MSCFALSLGWTDCSGPPAFVLTPDDPEVPTTPQKVCNNHLGVVIMGLGCTCRVTPLNL